MRINDFGGGLRNLTSQTAIDHEVWQYESTLPEVPLIPLDLRYGIPSTFKSQFGTSDLFIVNHGIILSGLDINDPNSALTYLSSIRNATRPGSLLMVIDSAYESTYRPDYIAQIIGATPFSDAVDTTSTERLDKAGLRPRRLSYRHMDGFGHLGDYINLPESHENDKLYFYTKN